MSTEKKYNLESMTRTSLLARNTMYNLLGQAAPFVAILIALPLLTQRLGAARFGVLGIAWVVLGYFGLFDLGLGRVITKVIAEKLGVGARKDINDVIWTGLGFMLLIGLTMLLLLFLLAPVLADSLLKIPPELQHESLIAFKLLAFSVPFVILTSGLRAILEAYQRFGVVNIIRTINGVLLYAAPLAVLPFTVSIHYIVLSIVAVRFLVFVLYALVCSRSVEDMHKPALRRRLIKPMLQLGGWMSVSNIIGPVMVYFDRFLIGVWLSVTAVTYYVTPYELVSKLLFVTAAFVRVLFPAFSMSLQADAAQAATLYSRSIRLLLVLFFPITLAVLFFARPGMTLWLNADFAAKGAGVMQWLAIGIFANAPGQVAFAAIQAAGRPDITAKIHLIETPIYLLALYLFVQHFGIVGAAMAWAGRIIADSTVLFIFAERVQKSRASGIAKAHQAFAASLGLFMVCLAISQRVSYLVSVSFLCISAPVLFLFLVVKSERTSILSLIRQMSKKVAVGIFPNRG